MHRNRLIGLVILAIVIVAVAGYTFLRTGTLDPDSPVVRGGYDAIELAGYVGGEKIGFLDDPEVQDILRRRYKITLDATKAGSIEMVRGDVEGVDFLWPASQVALEIYKMRYGPMTKEELIFNSPIVLYSWDVVADALEAEGSVERIDESYYIVDFPRLIELVQSEASWGDIGLDQLYGEIRIISTDPTRSNSGNAFSGLLVNTLNEGVVVDEDSVEQYIPEVQAFYRQLGFLHHSSGDLFDQYLKQGVGAYPLVVGYENQIVEFSLENKEYLPLIKDKIRILYPQPTVWSSHPLITINQDAERLIQALMDPDVQRLAWSKHGFRTGLTGTRDDPGVLQVAGIPESIDMVIPMPKATVMDEIIEALEQ